MTKTRNKLKTMGLLLTLVMIVSLLGIFSLTGSAAEDACTSTPDCTGMYANGICGVCSGYQPAVPNVDGAYEIGNAGQLLWFAELCNSIEKDVPDRVSEKEDTPDVYNEYYIPYDAVLISDITLNEDLIVNGVLTENTDGLRNWNTIGASVLVEESHQYVYDVDVYQGTFDGRGHTIRGLYVNDLEKERYAMFCCIGDEGVVKNVTFEDTYLLVKDQCSTVANKNYGKIQNCEIYGIIGIGEHRSSVTGVCAINYGQIENCINYAELSGIGNAYFIAGMVHKNYGNIESCANFGVLGAEENYQIGGIVVNNLGTVKNCYSNAPIISYSHMNGGIASANQENAIISNCYYNSALVDDGDVYHQRGTVENVEGKTSEAFASGEIAYLLGESWGQIIGIDANPVFATESNKVYYAPKCNGEAIYANSEKTTAHDAYVTAQEYFDADGKCLVCDTQAVATLTTTDEAPTVTYYMTFEEAADAAKEQGGGKITLLSDCYLDYSYYFAEGGYYLDLNGKKLICDSAMVLGVEDTASLTVDDSGWGGTIRTNEPTSQAIYNYGDLTVENGNIYGAMGIMSFVGDNGYPATLIINGGSITSNGYSTINTRSTAIINGGIFEARETFPGIDNHGDLTINYCELTAKCPLYNYEGKIQVNGGIFEGTEGPAVYMAGGEVTVSGGSFKGKGNGGSDRNMIADINDACTLKIEGGFYPKGFYSNKALSSLLSEGYSFYDSIFLAIDLDGTELEIENPCYVYPADATAVVIDINFNLVESFDSVTDAINYAAENNGNGIVLLRDTDENITDIPSDVLFFAGANVLSGDVVNHGNIDGGAFVGEVTNYGHIYSGTYSGTVHNEDGGKITGGCFDCEVILESGSFFKSNGYISIGDNYKLTNNGGTVECTSHLGNATCISDGVCLLCGEKFADKDPSAHRPLIEATCIALAKCKYCGEEYGELTDHNYNDGGDCMTEGCGIRAIVKVGDRFYLDLDKALANAEPGETVCAIRNFEVESMAIPAGKKFYGGEYIVTVTEGDVTVCGTIAFGSFVLSEDRVIGVESEGTVLGGSFSNDVNNRGSILGGTFIGCTVYNMGYIYNDNSVIFFDSAKVEDFGGTVDCYTHFDGVATCIEYPLCVLCGNMYGDFDPDYHTNVIEDEGVDPTCEETGLTAGSHCEDCGEVIVAQEEVPVLGHDMVTDAAVAPTCTATGLTTGAHCSRCNDATTAQETVSVLGHDMVTDAAVAPTCTATGLTVGAHCSRCNDATTVQETVSALGHDMVTDAAVAPTCTATGLTAGAHCSRCNDATTAQETVAAVGHKYDVDSDATCNNCGAERTVDSNASGNENNTNNNGSEAPEKEGLSGGAIAGIMIGSVVALGSGGFAIYWFVIKKKTWAGLIAVFKKN